ncbi:hypothetical protein PZB74_08810 [Porifericola rhodea]|uniref:hypothetical protein n=1 Tax=Porifericola rhodea TaxID=930972 RepID=UPI0026654B6D|nr:hypothetical protein [Porifericola rhodea]WKN33432.1 hypothetical protein PZB74_08810 [Porifericola rhodea]
MYIPFEDMPSQARVWIYQASRPLSQAEENYAMQLGQQFAIAWSAHGKPLQASVKIFHQRFLIVAVNEDYNQASGCAIDASVALVKELEEKFSTERESFSFFDRTKVAFLYQNEVFVESTTALKKQITEGKITPDTLTFNNLVKNVEELNKGWVIPAKDSWLSRYFKTA